MEPAVMKSKPWNSVTGIIITRNDTSTDNINASPLCFPVFADLVRMTIL